MVRTEYRYCNKCGRETSDGTMFDEHYDLDEFFCTGKTTKYDLRLPDGSKVFIMDGGDGTTEAYMKKHGKKVKVLDPCMLYYCGDCAEKLDYECTDCGSPLKIGGTRFNSERAVSLWPVVTNKRSTLFGKQNKVSAVKGKYFVIGRSWSEIDGFLKFRFGELDFGDDAEKARKVLEGKMRFMH